MAKLVLRDECPVCKKPYLVTPNAWLDEECYSCSDGMTIGQAIAICKKAVSGRPKLKDVIHRIERLRDERDYYRKGYIEAQSSLAWEKSDMKKWADEQRRYPDND